MYYEYFVMVNIITTENKDTDLTFGICGNGIKIPDVSTNENAVKDLVNRINLAGDVEPDQVIYLVENLVEELA